MVSALRIEKFLKINLLYYKLKRKIYDELLEWKKSKIKSALLIKCAICIEKSTVIEKFGKENYKICIVNFDFKLKNNDEVVEYKLRNKH